MLNNGIEQVSQIIQQNSAAAEESAASSQEMNAQASVLEDLVSQFRLR
jgi:methyl-accepting chemotaxis protein